MVDLTMNLSLTYFLDNLIYTHGGSGKNEMNAIKRNLIIKNSCGEGEML